MFKRLIILAILAFFFYPTYLYCNVRVTPQYLFLNSPVRSLKLNIYNLTNTTVEVWIELKYGYHITDDTGKVVILNPDILSADDQSAADWIKPYPQRFLLNANESQNVRLLAIPPENLPLGEYWARVIINSKRQVQTPKKEITTVKPGVELIPQIDLPFHYRNGKASTDLEIANPPTQKINNNQLITQFHFKRIKNSSYWGILNYRLMNKTGKEVKQGTKKIVVYKNFIMNLPIDIGDVPSGQYNLEVISETKRFDIDKKLLLQAEPKKWNLSVTIQ